MKTLEFLAALLLIAAATSRGQEQNAADPEVVRPGETTSLTTLSPSPTTRSPDEPTEEPSEDSSSSQEETTEETVEEPVARPSTGPPVHLVNDCDYVYHNLTYEVDGCRGAVPVASCDGYCVSDMAPEFFPSRRIAALEAHPYRSNCKCCTNTLPLVKRVDVKMKCPDGSTFLSTQWAATALNCGCVRCGGH